MLRFSRRYACASRNRHRRRRDWREGAGQGLRIGSKKRGKKAWTRSTVVSERGRPTTISHLPSTPSTPYASGFRCNHYVTHPHLSSHLSSPSSQPSSLSTPARADIAPRPYLVALPIALARGMVRLLLHDAYYLILEPFLFLPPRHFLQKRPIDPTHGLRPLLARRAIAAAYIFPNAG